MTSHGTCDVTSWAHVWKLRFSFFELRYDTLIGVNPLNQLAVGPTASAYIMGM
jgi:hypothetical protein